MSALSTRLTRPDPAATASTARRTTGMTSSHSPSTVVNIAVVSLGRPLARTTRTASATRPPTSSPVPIGVTLNATSMAHTYHAARGGQSPGCVGHAAKTMISHWPLRQKNATVRDIINPRTAQPRLQPNPGQRSLTARPTIARRGVENTGRRGIGGSTDPPRRADQPGGGGRCGRSCARCRRRGQNLSR